ncbi:MAG: tetratricopeptide repeat protein [Terriglobia bacterium]
MRSLRTLPWQIEIVAIVLAWLGLAGVPAVAQAPGEEDPALVRILVWQLERGDTAAAERLLQENLTRIKPRLEAVIQEIDREFDIIGRFGAVSIRFGPGYTALEESNRRHEPLFALYRRLGGDTALYQQFEARKLRIEGAHLTNEAEILCGENLDWERAKELYETALMRLDAAFAIAREQRDLRMMASAKTNIGSTLIRLGKPKEAFQAYEEGLRYSEQMPGDLYKGLFRLNLANAYVWVGDPDRALPHVREALVIFRRIRRGTWEANALMTMGNAYLRQQRFADAWETLTLSLQVAKQSGEYRVYGRSLLNLGMAGLQLKKQEATALVEEAIELYRKDDEVYPSIEREAVLQDGLRLLSQIARQAGNEALAEERMKQYYEFLGSNPDRYGEIRQSPCFEIYQARPSSQYQTAQ